MKNHILISLFFLTIAFSCRSNKPKAIDEEPQQAINEETVLDENAYEHLMDEGFRLIEEEKVGEIQKGVDLNKIVEFLGEPEEISEPVFSEVDGETYQTYAYKSKGIHIVFLIKSDSTHEVSQYEITEPCILHTSNGIGIGSTYADVQKAYGNLINPQESNNEIIVAGSVYGGMVFNLENKKVDRIFVGASAE